MSISEETEGKESSGGQGTTSNPGRDRSKNPAIANYMEVHDAPYGDLGAQARSDGAWNSTEFSIPAQDMALIVNHIVSLTQKVHEMARTINSIEDTVISIKKEMPVEESDAEQDASTLQAKSPQPIKYIIEQIFMAGNAEIFEDGMESEFSRSLTSAIKKHGSYAISAVADLVLSDKAAPAVASEALRWIGYIEDADSHASRLDLLISSLEHSSAWVRDGASLGLSYLGDSSAIAALQESIEHEQHELLRRNMGLAIADLQEGDD